MTDQLTEIVRQLNEWLEKDPIGVEAIWRTRFMVLLEAAPGGASFTMPIGKDYAEIGMIGLLNALFATKIHSITAIYDQGRLEGFDIWDSENRILYSEKDQS